MYETQNNITQTNYSTKIEIKIEFRPLTYTEIVSTACKEVI